MVRILSFFAIFFTSVAIAYFMYFRPEEDLPVYQPSDLNPALVDASAMREEDHRLMLIQLSLKIKLKYGAAFGSV